MLRSRLLLSLLAATALGPAPLALAGPCTDPGSNPPVLEGAPASARAGGLQGAARKRGAPPSPLDRYFSDPAAVEAGRAGLSRLLRATGAAAWVEGSEPEIEVDVWSSLPGLRYQVLETTYEYEGTGTDRWHVHHRLPRLVHLAPGDEGYVLTEVVSSPRDGGDFNVTFQRAIVDGPVAWSELASTYTREGDLQSRMLHMRESVLGAAPLCFPEVEIARIRRDDSAELFAVRLPRPSMVSATESVRELVLYVDPSTGAPLQWQFQTDETVRVGGNVRIAWSVRGSRQVPLAPEVRADLERRLVEAWRAERIAAWRAEGNEGEPPSAVAESRPPSDALRVPTAVTLPSVQLMSTQPASRIKRFEVEEAAFLPLPDGALDRPWLIGRVWTSPVHADFWDPPTADEGDDAADADG